MPQNLPCKIHSTLLSVPPCIIPLSAVNSVKVKSIWMDGRHSRPRKVFYLFLIFVVAILFSVPDAKLTAAALPYPGSNILVNPTFDAGLADWSTLGNVTAQNGTAVLSVQSASAWIMTDYIAVDPKQLLVFSFMTKADNILHPGLYQRAAISVQAYRSDMSYIRQYVVADFSGTFDWKQMNGELTIPDQVAFVRIRVKLSSTTGVLHIDDASATLLDKPAIDLTNLYRYPDEPATIARRGAIVANAWFNTPEIVTRFQEADFNFAWSQGSYLNQKMQYSWRVAFSAAEETEIAAWVNTCTTNGIECYLSVAPRGPTPSEATTYSSNTDVDLLVDKFEALYALGVRNFGLNFDDLRYVSQDVLMGDDVAVFNNLGEAHAYFVNEVYARFILTHAESNLMIVPLDYSAIGNLGSNEEIYLSELGALPLAIEMLSSIAFVADADAAIRLTGRPHVVWDNQFAYAYEITGADEYIAPLYHEVLDPTLIAGYAFLPLIPALEDDSLVSWCTAAFYAWSPERYDAERSFQLAVAKYQGVYDGLPIEPSPPDAIVQLAPLDSISSTSPTFSWRPDAVATDYNLAIYDETNDTVIFLSQSPYVATTICSGSDPALDTCSIQPGITLTPGAYRWLVQGTNDGLDGPWSSYP